MIVVLYAPPPDLYLGKCAEQVAALRGVWLGDRIVVVTDYVPVRNSSPAPRTTFEVREGDLVGVDSIVGFIHSHDEGEHEATEADLAGLPAAMVGGVWCSGEVSWYTRHGVKQVYGVPRCDGS